MDDLRSLIVAELEKPPAPVSALPAPWGRLFIRTMGLPDLLEFERVAPEQSGPEANIPRFAYMLSRCLVHPDGGPVITEEQARVLAVRDGGLFMALARQALAVNGFTKEGIDAEKNG